MTGKLMLSRRQLLKSTAAGAALGLTAGLLPRGAFADDGITVGFIYVGSKDDYGYNQSHHEAAQVVAKIPGVTVVEEENVPETTDVVKTMESMINLDGASLVFPTSFGYFDPFMLDTAKKYPDVQFRHCGGLWTDKDPANTGSYFGYIGLGQFLNGIVAGHMTKSKKLGFVAAKPIPQVLENINSFLLGARSVDPTITVQTIFTGEWSLAVKEAEATNALADQGIDVLTMHVDSPKVVVQTAAGRGLYVCGYHANQSALAPDKYLTGAEWNWTKPYTDFVNAFIAKQPLGQWVRGGIPEGFVKMSPLGPAVSADARNHFDSVLADINAAKGKYAVMKGPLKDNKGKDVVPAGKELPEDAIELESMDYLLDGVIGSTS
ncbi:MAG TPA: BMP family ABC transporter substrate-binding protein [Devosia sp.]|nr:BMP family ABC transporter substrate-binding protein [Devosia sp.]